MTRRTPDETVMCCYCKWWRDKQITGFGDCLARDCKSWYDESCKYFSKSRVPRKVRKIMAKAAAKTKKKMKEETPKKIKEEYGEGLPF